MCRPKADDKIVEGMRLTVCVTCAGAGTAKPSSQKNDKACETAWMCADSPASGARFVRQHFFDIAYLKFLSNLKAPYLGNDLLNSWLCSSFNCKFQFLKTLYVYTATIKRAAIIE